MSRYADQIREQIDSGAGAAGKSYAYNESHDAGLPADVWFQQSHEGLELFVVFFTRACRWSRCLGCNLPSRMSRGQVGYRDLMRQVDSLFSRPDVRSEAAMIRKLHVSNNGSVLDEDTFSSTALMYLLARVNLHLPNLAVLNLETRPEYVDLAELEFIARALKEGETPTQLELAIGFEAFDDRVRNEIYMKGLDLPVFEQFISRLAPYGFRLKCYFMQKPVPGMNDEEAIRDIQRGIRYLGAIARRFNAEINFHLNPTYVARGTLLEENFRIGAYSPPLLADVARAAHAAREEPLSVFIGLYDEGLAVEGGSFIRPDDQPVLEILEQFNRTQNYDLLQQVFE
jgi:radical SAM enzyme (TIGR01210 family)